MRICRKKRKLSQRDKKAMGASLLGLCVNLLLAGTKIVSGILFSMLSVAADGFNNLSDATGSIVTLISYRVAALPADRHHPYGHRRMEYFAGVVISFFILFLGLELFGESVQKVIHPVIPEVNILTLTLLGLSVLVKLGLFLYNRRIGVELGESATFFAASKDSLCDAAISFTVLVSMGFCAQFHVDLDGITGLFLSVFILYSGLKALRETMDPLLGAAPKPEEMTAILQRIATFDGVLGVHDLLIHDYGPGRQLASVHIEVDAGISVVEAHDIADRIERYFTEKGLKLLVHTDPLAVGDARTDACRSMVISAVQAVDPRLKIHDFRAVSEDKCTKLTFDLEVPYDLKREDEELTDAISAAVRAQDASLCLAVTVDRV